MLQFKKQLILRLKLIANYHFLPIKIMLIIFMIIIPSKTLNQRSLKTLKRLKKTSLSYS